MTRSQLARIEKAEFFRNTKTVKNGVRIANAWVTESGLQALCCFCGMIESHGDAGPVLAHCLHGSVDEYHVVIRRGEMPPVVKQAGETWGKVNRASGYRMLCDELLAKARGKFKKEKAA